MEFVINHKRFSKTYENEEAKKYSFSKNRIRRFPDYVPGYYNFFTHHAQKNYKLEKIKCICGEENDLILSNTDRHCVKFITVICKNCGLIRAKEYFRDEDVTDFYTNYYRDKDFRSGKEKGGKEKFDEQFKEKKFQFDLINRYKIYELKKKKIVDLGGAAGGVLKHFGEENDLFLFDFYDPYLEYAKSQGINVVKGGLEEINFKPDVIILSHVIEHWNNFEREIEKLIKVQEVGKTMNYIEFPGIDSIKKGRREGDVLGDLQVPHVYYFTSYVFENLMNRYGFEKLYIDTLIKSVFVYTGKKKTLINHYQTVYNDLIKAETTRKIQIFKNFIKLLIPKFLITTIRKFRNKGIKF